MAFSHRENVGLDLKLNPMAGPECSTPANGPGPDAPSPPPPLMGWSFHPAHPAARGEGAPSGPGPSAGASHSPQGLLSLLRRRIVLRTGQTGSEFRRTAIRWIALRGGRVPRRGPGRAAPTHRRQAAPGAFGSWTHPKSDAFSPRASTKGNRLRAQENEDSGEDRIWFLSKSYLSP